MFKKIFDKLTIIKLYNTIKLCHYTTVKSKQSHYDVLGIKEDASKKDIRLAYLKLSKQMHPDTSDKKNHDEFVKLTNAYNILNKEETKKIYDSTLQYNNNDYYTTFRQPKRKVYYEDTNWNVWKWKKNHHQINNFSNYQNNYYGIKKGVKKIKNITIILFFIFAIALSLGLHILSLTLASTFEFKEIIKKKSK